MSAGTLQNELVIVWRVTENCNLACPFCAYDRRLVRSRSQADLNSVIRFGRLLAEYQKISRRSVLVSWLGGEPFLWKPLLEVSRKFKHEFGLHLGVTTNGIALRSPDVRSSLVSDFEQVTISVDEIGHEHDRLRGANGLFESLHASVLALHALKLCRVSKLLIKVNTILMKRNIHQFEELCCELAGWGVSEVTFNILGGRDRPEFFPANHLTPIEVDSFCEELPFIRSRMEKYGLRIRGSDSYLKRISMLAREQSYFVEDCAPGTQFLFIDEQGLVAPCHFTVDGYGLPLERLSTVDDLQRLPTILSANRAKELLAPCFDCKSTQVFGKFSVKSLDVLET